MLVFLVHLLGCKQSRHYSHPVESNGAHVQLLSTARWRSVPGAWCLIKWMYVWFCCAVPSPSQAPAPSPVAGFGSFLHGSLLLAVLSFPGRKRRGTPRIEVFLPCPR